MSNPPTHTHHQHPPSPVRIAILRSNTLIHIPACYQEIHLLSSAHRTVSSLSIQIIAHKRTFSALEAHLNRQTLHGSKKLESMYMMWNPVKMPAHQTWVWDENVGLCLELLREGSGRDLLGYYLESSKEAPKENEKSKLEGDE